MANLLYVNGHTNMVTCKALHWGHYGCRVEAYPLEKPIESSKKQENPAVKLPCGCKKCNAHHHPN